MRFKACPCCATPREMATSIADSLFIDGDLRVASRLELKFLRNGFEQSGGGLCHGAVVDIIAQALGEHPNCKKIAAKLKEDAAARRKASKKAKTQPKVQS